MDLGFLPLVYGDAAVFVLTNIILPMASLPRLPYPLFIYLFLKIFIYILLLFILFFIIFFFLGRVHLLYSPGCERRSITYAKI